MVTILEKFGEVTVTVPDLLGIPDKRLKYTSPEEPLFPAKVTFEIVAGLEI